MFGFKVCVLFWFVMLWNCGFSDTVNVKDAILLWINEHFYEFREKRRVPEKKKNEHFYNHGWMTLLVKMGSWCK